MKHKFKLTRLWVASLLLLFGFTTNAWASDISANSTFVWDAGQESWTTAQLYIYKSGYNTYYDLTRIGQTTQFYKKFDSKWEGYTGLIVRKDDSWSAQTTDITRSVSGVTLFTYDGTKNNNKLNWQVTESAKKLSSGKKIYFDNTDSKWSAIYLKYGTQWFNRYLKYTMTKVTGTDNLYVAQMPNDAYCAKWYLADHYGYTNYHNIETYTDIKNRTHTQTSDLSSDITFVPSSGSGSSPKVWETSTFSGHTRTVTITAPTNGTITVTYTDENGTSQTMTSGSFSVAQTCIITVTATGNDGYHLKSLSVGGASFSSGETYIVRAATTISATFAGNVYDITYKDQDGADFTGENEDELPATHTYGTATTLVNATRAGYRFDGWFDNSGCTGSAIETLGATTYTSGITLYAKWTENKVYYNVNSGVKSFAGATAQEAKATLSIEATSGEYDEANHKALANSVLKFTVSNIATGYAIEGWYNDAACTSKIDGAGTSNEYSTPAVAGPVDVYVKILATQYNITYNNVYGTNPNPSSYNVEDEITFEALTGTRTGYTFTGWNPTGIAKGSTGDKSTSAQWQAKTYTISFNQNGGEGGQTATVTATYAAAMPTPITLPTRVGYKFNGYWDATSGGTQYYTAAGASARSWNKDANTTLYAQWTQMHVYVQGRMHVANQKRSAGGDITWTNSFKGGTQTETDNQWAEACRAIEMQLVTENDRTYYKLVTNATLSDLSTKFSGGDNLWQYFYLRSTSVTTSNGAWDGSIYKQVENGNSFKLADRGEEHARTWSTAEGHNPCFSDDDRSGYVVIYFDETKVWYELEEFTTYAITVKTYGGGTVTPSGTHQIGEVSLEISAQEDADHIFNGWTVRGSGITIDNANQATTKITATGAGEVSANFKKASKVYFQTCDGWGNDVYVYFYKGTYWDNAKGTGSYGIYNTTGNCISAGHMTYTGKDNIHYYKYDPDDLRSNGMSNVISFTQVEKYGHEFFAGPNSGDKVHVAYTDGFHPCDQPLYVAEEWEKDLNDDGKGNKLAAYYKGHWSNMLGDDAEDYLMMESENWKAKEEMRFKKDNDGNWIVIKNYSGTGDAHKDQFRVWRNCDGNWYGCGQTGGHNQNITSDISGWKLYTGTSNIDITPWKVGDYEFKWYPNSQELSVTYLGDITVANFPGEVSTFVNRQHKVQPDVTLRNGTSVTNVTITVNGNALPWSSSYATYEQNGTNLVITGNAIGTDDNLTVRYQNNKQEPYIVDRTLKVNVATPIVIQATLEGKSETEEDDYWSKTGLVHIHFWGTEEGTAQDLSMSYNEDTKVFSVTAPKIAGFKFMFWYGEDINMSANEKWRKTDDIINCTTNTCYSISYGTSKEATRTATDKKTLCSPDEYYVEITMKNGNTYKSNTISNLSKEVSFFAPKSNDDTYTGGTVRIVHNGAVSEPITGFTTAGVYVAQIADANNFVDNSIEPYTGKYYIRTDGAAGGWNEYKNADNELVEFTRRANKNESYSYYWVKNLAKSDKTNVKADVANDYNDNLAGMIENDKFTDGGGFIYQSTNGANVRFSYEPTTNEFKRAIIGGSTDDNFLNIYSKDGGRLYADKDCLKELNENANLSLSKFKDVSDWVYEKVVYAKADGSNPTNVILKSVFNGQTTHLLGYNKNAKGEDTDDPKPLEVLGATTNTGTYALRISYDYKRNRLMASWEPGDLPISTSQIIDADVLFIQKEKGNTGLIDDENVAQITYTQDGIDNHATLTSLKNIMYILEITPNVIAGTSKDNQLYWFSLPFNCKINDIFGVEDYVTLDANGRATKGTWGIQRYDGKSRADKGWFMEDTPEGFWKWMGRNETLEAGTGYVLVFDKTDAANWKSIGIEEPCEEGDLDCVDGKKTVQQKIKRLYFPSIGTSFEISYSGESSSVEYANEICKIEKRKEADSNWKVIGPMSYNNIGVDVNTQPNLTFYYTYDQSAAQGHRYSEKQTITESNVFRSFHSYMTQFGGTLTWKPFTKSEDVTLKAPLYTENSEFQGGLLTIELRNAKGEELNHTFINLSKNGTTGFDQNLDLTKITENCAQIASVSEDVLYAGNTLPLDIEMVPLNVKVVANGTYDIALAQSLEGLEVRLYDAFEQTTTPLDLMSAMVTLDKGEYKDRFFLQFVQKSPLTPTNFNGAIEQFNLPTDKTQKLLINDNIYLINGGRIYNASGTKVR